MSQARGFGLNGKSYYSNVTKPMDVNVQFTVTPTNGLGVTSVKSNGYVRNVFMHTSTTPGVNNGFTNPNPANGYGLIQFNNNFNKFLGGFSSFVSATATDTKIDNAALTIGQVYVITTLGDGTAAQWTAVGVPAGVTPAVGVSFTALATGSGSGNTSTSRVQLPTSSGISAVEIVGNPNTMIANPNIAANGGAWITFQFLGEVLTVNGYTPAGTINTPAFTGSALAAHTHNLLLKDAAVADGATTRVNAGANLLGANTGGDLTVTGGGANGGIVTASAGTPAGTIGALTFTGSAGSLTGTVALGAAAPSTGSIVNLFFRFDGSSVTIDGL